MKKLRILALILSLAMVITLLAGCNTTAEVAPSQEAPRTEEPAKEEEQPVEGGSLVWAGWSGEEASTKPVIQGMVDSWNAANPNTPVSWVGWPWADTLQQLIIRNNGSEQIDVAQIDSSMFPALVAAGALEDLSTVFDTAWLNENVSASALAFGQSPDGTQYGIPWTTASIGMLYNPTILKEAGFDAPPATMEEFEACMAKIQEMNPDMIPYALSTMDNTATADFMPWLWAYGGSIFDENGELCVNSDATIQVLSWYKDMAEKGYIRAAMSRFDARQLFAQGKIGFYDDAIMARGIAASNGVAEADLDATIQPMLRPVLAEGDDPTSSMWGHMLVIFKKSENKESAAEFIKHIISEEESLNYFKTSGMLPVMKTALEDPMVTGDAWAGKWSEITKYGRDNELKAFSQNDELSTIISEEIQAVVIGEKTPEEAAEAMQQRLAAAL